MPLFFSFWNGKRMQTGVCERLPGNRYSVRWLAICDGLSFKLSIYPLSCDAALIRIVDELINAAM
jgi:hypothetical protein